jgi:hypothetical protein
MSTFAPINDAGDKPYVVEGMNWGKKTIRLVYADNTANARQLAGLRGTGQYVTRVRRATIQDLEAN